MAHKVSWGVATTDATWGWTCKFVIKRWLWNPQQDWESSPLVRSSGLLLLHCFRDPMARFNYETIYIKDRNTYSNNTRNVMLSLRRCTLRMQIRFYQNETWCVRSIWKLSGWKCAEEEPSLPRIRSLGPSLARGRGSRSVNRLVSARQWLRGKKIWNRPPLAHGPQWLGFRRKSGFPFSWNAIHHYLQDMNLNGMLELTWITWCIYWCKSEQWSIEWGQASITTRFPKLRNNVVGL